MDLELNMNEDTILITPSKTKKYILKKYSDSLLPIKFISLEEFRKSYFFSYNNKALDYLISKYHYNLSTAKTIINNLYFIDVEKNYNDSKLISLQNIKKDLIENNYLEFNFLFKNYIKNKNILIYNYFLLEPYEEEIFKNNKIVNLKPKNINIPVYHCSSLEEEIIFVIENILSLIDKGVPLNKIIISNVDSEYSFLMYKLFSYYNIPLNINLNQNLYGTSIVKKYLETKELPGFINPIVKKLVDVINSLKDIEDSPNYQEFLVDTLKSTKLSSTRYDNAVNVVSDIPIVDDDNYLFIVSLNQDVLPKIYKDEDYLSDKLKLTVGLMPSYIKNKKEKERVISIISNTKNCILSYKDKSSFNEYLKSSLIDELNLEVIDYKMNTTNSNLYNKLLLGEKLDNYYKYNEIDDYLKKLYSHYVIPYNTYDNKYKNVKKEELYEYLNSYLKVSYTSLNSFYLCKFQYYIKYILKIDPYKSNFSTVIGNLFHYIFSVMDNPLFNLDREWDSYLEKQTLSLKGRFFLDNLKEDLKEDIRIIKDQDLLTNFKDKLYEKEVNVKLDKQIDTILTGKIDKIMYHNNLVSIIDYKTGSITTNINNLKYGLSMQLPIYLYLVNKSGLFTNPRIAGIYLQKVLNSNNSFSSSKTLEEMRLENLKLQGYSTADLEVLSDFDKTYEKSELIKSMKLNKDSSFSAYAKVLNDEEFDNILTYTDKKINEAVDYILDADFRIDPKVMDNSNLSCCYCKYKDLCFMTNKDTITLEKQNDLSFLDD